MTTQKLLKRCREDRASDWRTLVSLFGRHWVKRFAEDRRTQGGEGRSSAVSNAYDAKFPS